MKSTVLVLLTLLCIGCAGEPNGPAKTPSAAGPDRGEAIVAEHIKRDAAPFRKDHVRFTVTEKGGPPVVTEIDVWRRQSGDVTSTLSVITKPAEDAGTGSLAIEEKGKPSVIVTYAESRGEFRETDTGKMFIGGLTAQELIGEWNKYNYRLIGESSSGFEVEGKLKEGERSAIAVSRVVFDKQNYLPVSMELFDNAEKKIRSYGVPEIRTADGRPYIGKTVVTNYVYGSEITIEIVSREFPAKLDESLFTRDRLKPAVRK
ncbi:MAG: outer membrane lipoprotein-sorting protein [Pyrinomonadaceae bacterium]|nr:outer membrane lipoprotein-sorting protein [Pyrinomonadaceae bacterium]